MIFAVVFSLHFAFASSLMPNVTVEWQMELSKYDPQNHRRNIYEKVCKAMTEKFQSPCNTTTWSLENFMHNYLDEAGAQVIYRSPDNWTLKHPIIDYDEEKNFLNKFKINRDKDMKKNNSKPKAWTFKDFVEKYEPGNVYDQLNEQTLQEGRDYTHLSSIMKSLDSTDELLNLEVPRGGRRWWDNQWPMPQEPHQPNLNRSDDPDHNDPRVLIYFMRQDIYRAREKMRTMQMLREEYRTHAIYKMGYLFAKTDYACKVFASLSYKSFRLCSSVRIRFYRYFRLFLHYMDIAYNIERLISRWFDVDLLKDLLITNDILARKVILKDPNITTPMEVNAVFDEMFID